MNKILLLAFMFIGLAIYNAQCTVADEHWKKIGLFIVGNSELNNQAEFEAAKQALLNIKSDPDAQQVAVAIRGKWDKAGIPWQNEAKLPALMGLPRYPNMDAAAVKAAGKALLGKHKDFINTTLGAGCAHI